ncbi:hypothetical protein [Paludisphaera rhizosphaerae]|uniref:hypothetical protein n=1 Tax=Paludisphaera rhizosphaerae TaxID=2711216 RepID=UPI0013EA728A|nr:hypothetical protein [Paludisphaera rhizosphaerae]
MVASKNHDGAHDHESEWGLCKACKWWQLEPEAHVENLTLGLCIDEELQPYNLRVSGLSGCNHFMAGKPARAKGSAEAPPTAKATR